MTSQPRLLTLALASLGALAFAACGSSGAGNGTTTATASKGVITALGSIWVNGVEIDASNAAITIDDTPGHAQSELHVGMVVKVKGKLDGRTGTATEVEAGDAVRGKVGSRDGAVLRVGGHEVEVENQTAFEDSARGLDSIAVGDRVRVHGLATATGAIRASRVEKDAGAGEDFEIKGFVSDLSSAGFTLRVTPDASTSYAVALASGASLPSGIANGSFVEVRSAAAPVGGALTATLVQLEDGKLGEAEAEVEIEGIVTSGTAASFAIGGQAVSTSAGTVFENGAAADLGPGVKVEAEGKLDAQGVLAATKVSFRATIRLQAVPTALSAADARNGTFQLLGITVHADDLTEFKPSSGSAIDLAHLGTGPVQVRGTLHRNGVDVVATEVRLDKDTRPTLQGPISSANASAGTLAILGVTVDVRSAEAAMSTAEILALPAGTVVKARGKDASSFSGSTLEAKELEVEGSR